MTSPVALERQAFADTLADLGADVPTLCGDWTARDLAAHIIVRERRPDAAPGILVGAFAGYTDKVQQQVAKEAFDHLVDQVRSGPPFWNPMSIDAIARRTNTIEFFVHHEDLRRAQADWEPRRLPADLIDDLYAAFQPMAKLLLRSAEVGVRLVPTDGHAEILASSGDPTVTVSGPVGELVLWAYGRQDKAEVEYDGDADAIAELQQASFGI